MVRRLLTDTRPTWRGSMKPSPRARWRSTAHQDQRRATDTAIVGVGALTAGAALATVTDARDFKNGRQFAAWQGLVPRQDSSRRQSPAGPHHPARRHLSSRLLTQGARSALQAALTSAPRATRLQAWMVTTACARRLSQDLGGDRQQARADDLGQSRQGQGLRSRCLAPLDPFGRRRHPRRAAWPRKPQTRKRNH